MRCSADQRRYFSQMSPILLSAAAKVPLYNETGSSAVAEVPVAAEISPSAPPVPRAGDEVLMAFAGPARQRRVTVLFRLLLAIPQLIVLYVLSIVAELVAIAGWFAALFTGRLPAGLAGFLTGWLRWSARVVAYLALLTDRYPPFEMADADYPVRVSVAPGRLNRWAVLFRIILALPVAVLVAVLGYGSVVVGFVAWLIVLVTGTMPVPLYQAIAAVTRYGIRYYGYFFLLSGTYPGGLFGDPADTDEAAATAGPLAVPPGAEPGPPGYAPPGDAPASSAAGWPPVDAPSDAGTPDAGTLAGGQVTGAPLADVQPGPGPLASGETTLPAGWPTGPQAWRLVLSSAAKRLVALFIAVGVVATVAYGVLIGIAAANSSANVSRTNAVNSISAAHSTLLGQLSGLSQQISVCQNQSAQAAALKCVTKYDRQAAADLGAFADRVSSTPVPSPAAPAAAQVTAAASQLQAAFQQLGTATSVAQYEQIDSSTVAPKVTQFNEAYVRLGQALEAS
jgi:Domain of unknown function (DUF4389)